VVLTAQGGGWIMHGTWRAARPAGVSASESLHELLAALPPQWRSGDVYVAITPGALACADCVTVPYRTEAQIESVAGSLAESRCAGESAEELAIDVVRKGAGAAKDGSVVHVVAIRQAALDAVMGTIQKALPSAQVKTVTGTPVALAEALTDSHGVLGLALESAGEGALLHCEGGRVTMWRFFPLEGRGAEAEGIVRTQAIVYGVAEDQIAVFAGDATVRVAEGLGVEAGLLPAAAVGVLDAELNANLLRGWARAPKGLAARLRAPLLAFGVAAALFLAAVGVCCHRYTGRTETDLSRCRDAEKKLHASAFPGQPYKAGELVGRMQREVSERRRVEAANQVPSALAFWAEVGAALPEADKVGFVLEELQLGTDGGRLTGRVPVAKENPLANAALLEGALNGSPVLTARGEFETKEQEVAVRVRLDYRAPAQTEGVRP
jgi:hypothetical protein